MTLVCVAPDGSLEVWELHSVNINYVTGFVGKHWQVRRAEDHLSGFWDYNMPREFWDRIVLGEL